METGRRRVTRALIELTAIKQRVAALQSDVTHQQADVAALRSRVGEFASAQYRSDGMDTTVQLLLASQPDDFLARMSTVASLTERQSAPAPRSGRSKRCLPRSRPPAQRSRPG